MKQVNVLKKLFFISSSFILSSAYGAAVLSEAVSPGKSPDSSPSLLESGRKNGSWSVPASPVVTSARLLDQKSSSGSPSGSLLSPSTSSSQQSSPAGSAGSPPSSKESPCSAGLRVFELPKRSERLQALTLGQYYTQFLALNGVEPLVRYGEDKASLKNSQLNHLNQGPVCAGLLYRLLSKEEYSLWQKLLPAIKDQMKNFDEEGRLRFLAAMMYYEGLLSERAQKQMEDLYEEDSSAWKKQLLNIIKTRVFCENKKFGRWEWTHLGFKLKGTLVKYSVPECLEWLTQATGVSVVNPVRQIEE